MLVINFQMMTMVVLGAILHSSCASPSEQDCWGVPLYSTKTSYDVQKDKFSEMPSPPGNCEAVQINMVHRHGHRYPSIKDVRKMTAASEKLNKAQGKVVPGLPLKLPWKCPYTEAQDKLLTTLGEKELYHIGKNIQLRFPGIFKQPYSPLKYKFQSSCKLRCTHSSSALAAGLFEYLGNIGGYKYQPIALQSSPCNDDPVLRFFEDCKKYVEEVDESDASSKEMNMFAKGSEMKNVIKKVHEKLGTNETDLNASDLKALFVACAYDIALFNGTSGLCSLFDKEDSAVMEYLLDLKHFYKRSIGFKITYESSCPLLRDIVNLMTLAVSNSSNSYVGIFRSAHAETLMPLLALLGVYLDKEHLTASNYDQMRHRVFRPACFSSFSGNLYFVLYNCQGNYKIQLYVNERLTKLPCCDSEIDCPFETFAKYYDKYVQKCNFSEMCKTDRTEL